MKSFVCSHDMWTFSSLASQTSCAYYVTRVHVLRLACETKTFSCVHSSPFVYTHLLQECFEFILPALPHALGELGPGHYISQGTVVPCI